MKRFWTFDRMLFVLWCLLLAGQGVNSPVSSQEGWFGGGGGGQPPSREPGPGSRGGGPAPLHPRFTPVAGELVPPIGGSSGGLSLPPPVGFPGAFGQNPNAFSPPSPTSFGVLPPPIGTIPPGPLGQGSSAFSPPAPQMSIVPLAGNAPALVGSEGIPLFVPFALGPTAILNQFVQPPLVPFGQVGIPVQSYLPGFFTGNLNPFNRSCNYYFFAGCGASGGAVTDFNFSTR